jgi:hypothetical protein
MSQKLVIVKNFGLELSFKYSKNTMVTIKPWYSKQSFLQASQTPLGKKYHSNLKTPKMLCFQTPPLNVYKFWLVLNLH